MPKALTIGILMALAFGSGCVQVEAYRVASGPGKVVQTNEGNKGVNTVENVIDGDTDQGADKKVGDIAPSTPISVTPGPSLP